MGLFRAIEPEEEPQAGRPLADRMRPQTLDEFIGQEDLLGPGKPLRTQIERDDLGSMLLWGPPGCGKTTLARIIAKRTRSEFVPFSAVLSGIKEIKEVMAKAERARHYGRRTIVFVDEVHRFNRAQQDAFLPHVEAGNILLIGATTENPSFEVIAPLLSRMKVYVLHALAEEQIAELLRRAIADPVRGLGKDRIEASEEILERIAVLANGDARAAYNTLEALVLGPSRARTGGASSPRAGLRTCCKRSCCRTTNPAKNTSISFRRCTNPCAIPIPMRRSTGWRGCSNRAKTRCTWRGGWCAWRARTLASRSRARWR